MFKLIFALLFTVLLSACGSSSGSSSNSSTNPITPSNPGSGGSLQDLTSAPQGWKSNCQQGSGIQSGTLIQVSSNQFVMTSMLFDDGSNCTAAYRGFRITYNSSTHGTNLDNSTATNLNLIVSKVEFMAVSSATDMNLGNECGITWSNNSQWVDVSSTSCMNDFSDTYTIFKVINGNVLELGTNSFGKDGSDATKRHSNLSTTGYLKF